MLVSSLGSSLISQWRKYYSSVLDSTEQGSDYSEQQLMQSN